MAATPSELLSDLAEKYWWFVCKEFPLTAILAGVEPEGDTLFRMSEADYVRRNQIAEELLDELSNLDPGQLRGQERATDALLRFELEDVRRQFAANAHLRPSLFPLGPEGWSAYFANSTSLGCEEDARKYLRRLATVPGFLQDLKGNLEKGRQLGIAYPRLVLKRAVAAIRAFLGSPTKELDWYRPFVTSIVKSQIEEERKEALALIENDLRPSFLSYADYIEETLMESARDSIACKDDYQGSEFYETQVRNYTTTRLTADEIHDLGLSEVARLNTEMAAVVEKSGVKGGMKEFRRNITENPHFTCNSSAALRTRIESLAKQIDGHIPALFGRIPRITYGVRSIPAGQSALSPPAYAQPGPANGSAAGIFWLTSLPEKCPAHMHIPLTLHEAWPGHLMHIALIQEMDALPSFRRHGAMKYNACLEGWALYCETLGYEMGLYQEPLDEFGRLDMEMWRAARLVVDTGIHHKGWSRDDAIQYMQAHLSLPAETVEAEVDRYVGMPGQALAYQIGAIKFTELRKRAEASLGSRFVLRDFHDAVTGAGAVTLPVLDDLVSEWIEASLST